MHIEPHAAGWNPKSALKEKKKKKEKQTNKQKKKNPESQNKL